MRGTTWITMGSAVSMGSGKKNTRCHLPGSKATGRYSTRPETHRADRFPVGLLLSLRHPGEREQGRPRQHRRAHELVAIAHAESWRSRA